MMTIELWELAAVLLLAAAAAASILAFFVARRRWRLLAVLARLAALGVLIAALVLSVVARGQWSPFDLHQLSVALAIATLATGLVLFRARDLPATEPVLDTIILGIVLARLLIIRPGGPLLACAQRDALFGAQWALFVLGAGGAVVAAGAALGRAVRRIPWLRALWWAPVDDPFRPLYEGALLTLLPVGAGLALGVVWAWRAYGTLYSGDPRQGWMAGAGLLAAMSLVSWQLDRGSGRWASVFAGIAGAAILFGLLAIPDLQRLWGI